MAILNATRPRGVSDKEIVLEKLKGAFPNGCRKILLVNPVYVPEEDHDAEVAADNRYPVYQPYGLAVITSYLDSLKDREYVIDIVDLNLDLQVEFKDKGPQFDYNAWKERLRASLEEFSPDLVGLTCMFTITYRQLKRTAEFIKVCRPSVPVFAGGVHTSTAARLILKDCASIDFIFLFEANPGFSYVLDVINDRAGKDALVQLATRLGEDDIFINERAEKTLEAINVIPNYRDLPVDRYSEYTRIGVYYWLFPPGTRAATVLANTGCRAQCSFCSVRWFNGRGVESRSVESVLDELEWLRDTYGIRHIMWLDDDLFNGDPVALFNGMVKRRIGITWDASNGVIASATTEEIVHAAYESGCIALSFGVESGNAEVLKFVKKPSGPRHYYRVMEILRKYPRIFTRFLLMVGFFPDPKRGFHGESISMIKDTIDLTVGANPDWSTIQPLNLIPGVPITNDALEEGLITEKEMIDGSERPYVGSTGGVEKRIKQEKLMAKPFVNLLETLDPGHIPSRTEIQDIHWVMDYKVNYEKLWGVHDPVKLKMLRKMFVYFFDKTHRQSALGHLFFALIEARLGNVEGAKGRLELAMGYVRSSDYWRVRFEAMDLYAVAQRIAREISIKEPERIVYPYNT